MVDILDTDGAACGRKSVRVPLAQSSSGTHHREFNTNTAVSVAENDVSWSACIALIIKWRIFILWFQWLTDVELSLDNKEPQFHCFMICKSCNLPVWCCKVCSTAALQQQQPVFSKLSSAPILGSSREQQQERRWQRRNLLWLVSLFQIGTTLLKCLAKIHKSTCT